jgi:hypothetical protein
VSFGYCLRAATCNQALVAFNQARTDYRQPLAIGASDDRALGGGPACSLPPAATNDSLSEREDQGFKRVIGKG